MMILCNILISYRIIMFMYYSLLLDSQYLSFITVLLKNSLLLVFLPMILLVINVKFPQFLHYNGL